MKHLADATVTYTHNNEESELNSNVYDLVKNHYHKVFNKSEQNSQNIYYNYIVPFGGLNERAYYFTHNNTCYVFTPDEFITADTELRFYPDENKLMLNESSISYENIDGSLVDENYLLHFSASTDWNKINEWNFGDNLTVSVRNGRATINAKDVSGGQYENNFSTLADVNVEYKDANLGKLLMLAKDADNNYMIKLQEVPLREYMLTEDYVADSVNHIIKKSVSADVAATAQQGVYTVDNSKLDNTHLWSSDKIASYVSQQITDYTPEIHCGYSVPTNDIGKDGDIYILIAD